MAAAREEKNNWVWLTALGIVYGDLGTSPLYTLQTVSQAMGMMMIATVAIAVAFGSSDNLAGAYGTAASTTMLLTTCLLYAAMRGIWRWSLAVALAVAGVFLIVDFAFFNANLLKITEGGWLPLTLGAGVFFSAVPQRGGSRSQD